MYICIVCMWLHLLPWPTILYPLLYTLLSIYQQVRISICTLQTGLHKPDTCGEQIAYGRASAYADQGSLWAQTIYVISGRVSLIRWAYTDYFEARTASRLMNGPARLVRSTVRPVDAVKEIHFVRGTTVGRANEDQLTAEGSSCGEWIGYRRFVRFAAFAIFTFNWTLEFFFILLGIVWFEFEFCKFNLEFSLGTIWLLWGWYLCVG